jgi:hypothetical protein
MLLLAAQADPGPSRALLITARPADHLCPSLFSYFHQFSSLLISHYLYDLFESMSHQVVGILNSSHSPQRTAIQRSA